MKCECEMMMMMTKTLDINYEDLFFDATQQLSGHFNKKKVKEKKVNF